jgi:hypothetical protein
VPFHYEQLRESSNQKFYLSLKPQAAQRKFNVIAWFEWAKQERIVITMSGEIVYTGLGRGYGVATDDAAVWGLRVNLAENSI